jgi:hypothetical protein
MGWIIGAFLLIVFIWMTWADKNQEPWRSFPSIEDKIIEPIEDTPEKFSDIKEKK